MSEDMSENMPENMSEYLSESTSESMPENLSKHQCTLCGHVEFTPNVNPGGEKERTRLPRRVIRDKREFDNTYHPGVESADLVHEVHQKGVNQIKPHPGPYWVNLHEGRIHPKQLCHNCGWTTANELGAGYTSRVKVLYTRGNSGIWDLGPNGSWMLKDEPNDPTRPWSSDYTAQQVIKRARLNVPLVEMHRFGGPDDKFHFTIMSRAKGSRMDAIWKSLAPEQKKDVMESLRDCIKEWRKITRLHMQKVDGSELRDNIVGTCNGWECIKAGKNEEEWLEHLTPTMRKGLLLRFWHSSWYYGRSHADQLERESWVKEVDKKIVQLKADFPKSGGPYFLTHGDLKPVNIFISDENPERKFKVSAIIDWERAGFCPWWVESWQGGGFELAKDYPNLLHPGHDRKDFQKIWNMVSPVREAWLLAGNHTSSKHKTDRVNRWFRPPFCDCQPYCQEFMDNELGWEDKHLDYFDADSTDSADSQEDGYKKFRKSDREFLRWFNKLSNYDSKTQPELDTSFRK